MKGGTVAFFPNNVDYERISEYENMIAIDLEMLNYTSDHIEYYTTKKYDELCRLFTDLYNAWISPQKSRKYKSISILYEILAVCSDECSSEENRYQEFFSKALEYIHRNYGDANLNIATITKIVSTNETYLRKAFQDYLGMSPKKYIDNLRLKKAKSMLKSGYYSIKEIAETCGFSNEKYFSTFFLKHQGCSPSSYKYDNADNT
jgi:YesN/AraC family two-component response regulator